MRARRIAAAAALPIAVAAVFVVDPSVASAQGDEPEDWRPSGCRQRAFQDLWEQNCWVGINYSDWSNLVLGVETAAKYFPPVSCTNWFSSSGVHHHYNFTRDGKYDNHPDRDLVIDWQQMYDVTQTGDGIVGSSTWFEMEYARENFLGGVSAVGTLYKYYDGCADQDVFAMKLTAPDVGIWKILQPGGGTWPEMRIDQGPPYP
ncbi:MAG TPA: hypothetical protein VK507_04345 [Iamia sp.]|nr:hypothetical protein [Iamia sp.]